MITAEESDKLKKFREIFPKDLLAKDKFEDDYFLIRWLRARGMDLDKASEMLKKSLKWREEVGADTILEREDIPEKYKKLYPTGLLGRDEEDCIVILLPLGRFNHRILLGENDMETALKYNMMWTEKMMKLLKEVENETGKKGLRIIQVVDMEYYSYKELTYGPAREFMIKSNKNFDENYPEMLKSCIVINAPRIFTLLYNFIKPFTSKDTLAKVKVYGGQQNEEVWKEIIRSKFNPECIPVRWGGTRKGSDQFCSQDEKIWIDGPIPLSYFISDPHRERSDLLTVKISARDKFQLHVPLEPQKGTLKLHWKFKVESHDIGFGISFQPKGQENEAVIVPMTRIDSKLGIQESFLPCSQETEGAFIITFDNKYSLSRSKTVHYSVEVNYAQDKDEQATVSVPN